MKLEEISKHGEEEFYTAVGEALASLIGLDIRLDMIKTSEGRQSSHNREIIFRGKAENNDFLINVHQHWEDGQSPTKPYTSVGVTDLEGFGNGSRNIGRVAFWRDDPHAYAQDLDNAGEITEQINLLLS